MPKGYCRKAKGKGKRMSRGQTDSGNAVTHMSMTQQVASEEEEREETQFMEPDGGPNQVTDETPASPQVTGTDSPASTPVTTTAPTTPTTTKKSTLTTTATRGRKAGKSQRIRVRRNEIEDPETEEDDDDDREEEGCAPPRKKSKFEEQFTPEQEDELVEWFQANPIFFDQSLRDFKDRKKRDRLLAEKGKEFGVSGHYMWQWFKNMRTVYGKLKRVDKSGQAAKPLTARKKWTLQGFHFLDKHLTIRTECRQLGQVPQSQPDEEEEEEEEEDSIHPESSQQAGPSTQGQPSFIKPKPKSKKTMFKSVDEAILNMCEQMSTRRTATQSLQAVVEGGTNNRVAYCQYLGLEVGDLTEEQWTSFQQDTMSMLIRCRQQRQRQQQPQPHHQPQFQPMVAQNAQRPGRPSSGPPSTVYDPAFTQQHQAPWQHTWQSGSSQGSGMLNLPDTSFQGINTSEAQIGELLASASSVLQEDQPRSSCQSPAFP